MIERNCISNVTSTNHRILQPSFQVIEYPLLGYEILFCYHVSRVMKFSQVSFQFFPNISKYYNEIDEI